MQFTSTSDSRVTVSLTDAVARPLASGGALYMPEAIPLIPRALFNNIEGMSLRDIAYVVATSFLGPEVSPSELKNIVDFAFGFEAPLRRLNHDTFVLELYHGPTLTFKDYGARFMARLLDVLEPDCKRTIMVATTGNTGAATANGFVGSKDAKVLVLFPKGRLSRPQMAQISALGGNIYPVEVTGSVEDCKRLMAMALADDELKTFNITAANSINVARLIPQIAFAMYAYARLRELEVPDAEHAIYGIPAGNLSNVVATGMAFVAGMPLGKIVGVTNENAAFGKVLNGEPCETTPVHTLAPSIDMAYPSGWPRLQVMLEQNPRLKDVIESVTVPDVVIADTINEVRRVYGYTLDPHSAAAYAGVNGMKGGPKVVFATGHPAKQLNIMTKITGSAIELPVQLTRFMNIKRPPIRIAPTLPALRKLMHTLN